MWGVVGLGSLPLVKHDLEQHAETDGTEGQREEIGRE